MSAEMDDTNLPPIPPSSTTERQKVPSEAASSRIKRKAFKPSSVVWSHFTKFVTEEGHIKAKCIIVLEIFLLTLKRMGQLL